MALLIRKTKQPADTVASGDEIESAQSRTTYSSQAFELWDAESRRQGKRHILDLGTAVGDNISYFGELPCRLEIADLPDGVPTRTEPGEGEDPEELERSALQALLPSLPPRSQDGALCWDLVNYMTRSQIILLGQWLGQVMALDGVVMLSLHTGTSMPATPCQHRISGPGLLARQDSSAEEIACPRYSQGDLKRDWPDFEVLRSYLLRSEAQEFVLRRV